MGRVPRRAQGMTEYIILVGLIAIGLIAAAALFRGKLHETYGAAASAIETRITTGMDGDPGPGVFGGESPGGGGRADGRMRRTRLPSQPPR